MRASSRPDTPPLTKRRLAYFRERLLRQRRNLTERINASQGSLAAASSIMDDAELAANDVVQQTSCAISSADSSSLAQIDHALAKFDQDTYGVCEDCGRPISQHRLKVMPAASLCVTCKQREESEDRAWTGR